MRFLSNLIKKYKRATPKQLVMTGVFMLAFAGAIGAGFAAKGSSFAAGQSIRDCSYNSIDNYNPGDGSCGALSGKELIDDINRNIPGDLKTIYADPRIGLTADKYARFAKDAVEGTINKNGQLIVKGEVVMTDVWTMGRTTLNGAQPTPIVIGDNTYYHSHPSASFGSWELDAMVLFDDNGTVEVAVLEPCGNPVTQGKKITSGGECKALNPHKVSGKQNTYTFTTNASKFGLAKWGELRYYYKDGNEWKWFDTQSSPEKYTVQKEFKKTTKVKVEVDIYLPGGKVKRVTCEYEIKVEEEKFVYTCDALYATSKDNRTFRFTVKASHSTNVKLLSADFNLDGVKTNVTNKDDKGNFYKEYTFNDEKSHTVAAVLNVEYTKDGKTQKAQTKVSSDCTEKVKPKQPPVCKHNPKLPPEHPDCKPPVKECKPGIPEGDERCETCEDNPGKEGCELPETGPAGIAALFAGVTAAGTIGHRLFANYRNRR